MRPLIALRGGVFWVPHEKNTKLRVRHDGTSDGKHRPRRSAQPSASYCAFGGGNEAGDRAFFIQREERVKKGAQGADGRGGNTYMIALRFGVHSNVVALQACRPVFSSGDAYA